VLFNPDRQLEFDLYRHLDCCQNYQCGYQQLNEDYDCPVCGPEEEEEELDADLEHEG
jgi:hypothetical protein